MSTDARGGARRALATLAALVVTLGACREDSPVGTEPEPEPDAQALADGGDRDASTCADVGGGPGPCVLDGDRCVGDPKCCPPIDGWRVDLERGCREPTRIYFNCWGAPISCVVNEALGCYQRDAPDGGVETFLTPSLWAAAALGPGYRECDPSVRDQVFGARTCK